MDNDQIGPLLTDSSDDDESILRKRKNIDINFLTEGVENDFENLDDSRSYRTPLSERMMLESISVLYSKSFYPTSLGLHLEEDD